MYLQYRPPYMPPTQQYPVTSGTAGFYPGTSPAEYSAYGKGCCPKKPPPKKTAKHNHEHEGFSGIPGDILITKRLKFYRDFSLKHLVLAISICSSLLSTRYHRVHCGFAWLVGVFNVFLGQNTAVCGELPVACGLA